MFADKEKSQQELIKMHDVLLKAIAYYKRKLHIHLRIDENGVILIHLLNISTPGCKMCSLKLSYGDGKWSCKYSSERLTQLKYIQLQSYI
jgi:hypothetical protein